MSLTEVRPMTSSRIVCLTVIIPAWESVTRFLKKHLSAVTGQVVFEALTFSSLCEPLPASKKPCDVPQEKKLPEKSVSISLVRNRKLELPHVFH